MNHPDPERRKTKGGLTILMLKRRIMDLTSSFKRCEGLKCFSKIYPRGKNKEGGDAGGGSLFRHPSPYQRFIGWSPTFTHNRAIFYLSNRF